MPKATPAWTTPRRPSASGTHEHHGAGPVELVEVPAAAPAARETTQAFGDPTGSAGEVAPEPAVAEARPEPEPANTAPSEDGSVPEARTTLEPQPSSSAARPAIGIYPENSSNLGLLVAPGAGWTASTGPGLVSVTLDLGLEWAMQRGMGVGFVPRLGVAYEAPVSKDVTLGVRAGLWVRWASGSARIPGLDDRLLGELAGVVTWKVF